MGAGVGFAWGCNEKRVEWSGKGWSEGSLQARVGDEEGGWAHTWARAFQRGAASEGYLLPVEIWPFHEITRKAFHGPTHGRL